MVMSMAHVRAHMPAHDPGNTHNIEFVEQNRFDVIDRTASRQADLYETVTSLRKLSTEAG